MGKQLQDGQGGDALAAAGLPYNTQGIALFYGKLTSSTAVTVPLLVLNCVFKCLTSNNGCAIFYLLCRAGTGNIPVPLLRHDYSTCHSQTERFKRL